MVKTAVRWPDLPGLEPVRHPDSTHRHATIERARENELKSVGFCILSAGIFRGGCPLKIVIETGLKAIAKNTYSGLETVVFCGFTPQEQGEIHDLAASLA